MRGMLEFQERDGSEAGCIEALARLRWPQGTVCARLAASGGLADLMLQRAVDQPTITCRQSIDGLQPEGARPALAGWGRSFD